MYFNELNQPEKALEYLTKGLAFREEIGDLGEVARSLVILSNFHFQQKEYAKGKQYAQRALEIGEKIGSLDIQSSAFGRLSEIAEANGDFQAA